MGDYAGSRSCKRNKRKIGACIVFVHGVFVFLFFLFFEDAVINRKNDDAESRQIMKSCRLPISGNNDGVL